MARNIVFSNGFVWNRSAIDRLVTGGAIRIANRASNRYIEIIRMLMSLPKTGRIYRSGESLHQASAPGEPPASDSHTLERTLKFDLHVRRDGRVWTIFRSDANYILFLELGTRRMAARPMWMVALAILRREMAGWRKA